MIPAVCTAIAILACGAAVHPRPRARRAGARPAAARHRRSLRWSRSAREPDRVAAEVAAWCEGLARVVRSGSTLTNAVRTVEPPACCSDSVERIILAVDRGARLTDALVVSTDSPHLDLAVTVLRACATEGGPPAEPLDRCAMTLRARAADAAERRTQSAQARLSATVMTVLPVAMLLLLLLTSSPTREAAASRAGLVAISIGGALNVSGWRWMRRIITGATS